MKRQGFALGVLSIGGQVLLLRELVSSLNGDEIFLGTALFGWLVAVAAGAYLGGRIGHGINLSRLFALGAILTPVMIIAARLSPLAVTDFTGEIVPLSAAVAISFAAMCPVGFISGRLFPAITQRIIFPATEAIVTVYLFEGIGAFVGGVVIALVAGEVVSTLALGLCLTVVVMGITYVGGSLFRIVAGVTIVVLGLAAAVSVAPGLDKRLDEMKYPSFEVLTSSDTHYGHQTILRQENSLALMTDNEIEAIYPNPEGAENALLAPLVYYPEARRILYIGRPEFGVAQLAEKIPSISLTALDPRAKLTDVLAGIFPEKTPCTMIDDDPISYLSRPAVMSGYDMIILNPGELDSYQTSRFLTAKFFLLIRKWLDEGGVLCIPTAYDTDRYITSEQKPVLSIVYRTLTESFAHVLVWPGTMTLFLASDAGRFSLPYDSIAARIARLPITPDYISPDYLVDRLNPMKSERLMAAVADGDLIHTIQRPILPHYQALYRSKVSAVDRALLTGVLDRPWWVLIIPLSIVGLFGWAVRRRGGLARFGLFLYFTAGVVSLSLELISFYLYQSSAGSLYAEMAALIGAFMLGLAAGTYYCRRVSDRPLEYLALVMLLAAKLIFLTMYDGIGPDALLYFHSCFLFVTAAATATLFVGATNRYYQAGINANRGVGYAWELAGSALGALLTLTILLPVIGLTWLMISLMGLIVLALAGAVISRSYIGDR